MEKDGSREDAADVVDRPFFKRRETWLVACALLLLPAALLLPIDLAEHQGAGLDPLKVRLGLGIFLCIAFLWVTEALPLAVSALLVPVLATLTKVSDLKSAMAGFADPLIFLFFGGFALASAMAAQGLDRWIADRIVRGGKGSFIRVSHLIFGVTAALSMWMSNTATTALMIPLVLGISGRMPEDASASRRTVFLLLGTAYASSIGGLGTLVGTPPNGIAAATLGVGFVEWLRFGIPAVLLILPVMVLVLRLVFRPGDAPFAMPARVGFEWTRARVTTLVIFALAGLGWIFGGVLKAQLGIGGSTDTLVALLAVAALVFFRVVGWRQIEKGTEWGVLLLFGGGIALSGILDDTGASLFMAREIVLLISGWPLVLVIAAALLFVILLGEFSSNTASAALLVPIFFSVAGELDLVPSKLVIPLALAASCGFMLPVATPPNAIVFATGKIPQRSMLRAGVYLDLASLAILTLLALWIF